MKKKYIKNQISEELYEDGGASVAFVDKQTIPLDGAIDEAIAGNYVIGRKNLIFQTFIGLMNSIAEGIKRDGKARQIGDFLTLYPVVKGVFDLERGFDADENKVIVRCKLLNEMDIDTTGWTFEDVTPGKRAFSIESVKAGDKIGEYVIGQIGHINGRNLPSTAAGEELRVDWEAGAAKGTVPSGKATSDVSRIDIAADALPEIAAGTPIVFTVRGNYSKASCKATVAAAPEPTAHIDEWYAGNAGNGVFQPANFVTLKGGGIKADAENLPSFAGVKNGNPVNGVWPLDKISVNTDEQLVMNYTTAPAFSFDDGSTVTITHKGITVTGVYNPV